MIRSTRQGSVLRSASGRSRSSALYSSSSSAVGPFCRSAWCIPECDDLDTGKVLQHGPVVLREIVEVGGDPDVPRAMIHDESVLGQPPHRAGGILAGQH